MSSESGSTDIGKIPTTFNYSDPFSVSTDLPIPPKMVEESMRIIQEESEKLSKNVDSLFFQPDKFLKITKLHWIIIQRVFGLKIR